MNRKSDLPRQIIYGTIIGGLALAGLVFIVKEKVLDKILNI